MNAPVLIPDEGEGLVGLRGAHPCMIELHDAIRRAAALDAAVVVWGPTGSGKELVARAVHQLSAERRGPFCAVNVAALPEGVVESELFGVVRGAFTGAVIDRPGIVESAEGGSLFLDEAGDLPLWLQPKLLRVLDYGEVRRVGATKTLPVAFRLIVAVQDDPYEIRRAGRWRDDLYYRITSVVLRVPPLKERRSDIPDLANAFLRSRKLPGIESAGLKGLLQYDWPGNVRELQQTLLRAAFYADGGDIKSAHVAQALATAPLIHRTVEASTLGAVRREHVRQVVSACAGDTQRAAEILGISRRHVYRLLHTAPEGDGSRHAMAMGNGRRGDDPACPAGE